VKKHVIGRRLTLLVHDHIGDGDVVHLPKLVDVIAQDCKALVLSDAPSWWRADVFRGMDFAAQGQP